jgi:UDP-N-acetylmuramate dehydrogenase
MHKSGSYFSVLENVPLAPFTTMGVGGPARFFIKAAEEAQISDAMEFAHARGCPVFILGGGSNIVVSDKGFPGLIIKIELPGIQSIGDEDSSEISAGAGVEWDSFVQYAVNRNLGGIECLSGIPGTVGGAPVQNIGAYGEEMSDVILGIRVLDRTSRSIIQLDRADCQFSYRSSIFNTTQKDRYIILRVEFSLPADGKPSIHYKDLQHHFGPNSKMPTLDEVRKAVLRIRESKAMVLRDDDADSKSVGSFFKNPVLKLDAVADIEREARARGIIGARESIPRFPAHEGTEKLPAAWLIEHAGFHKGYILGRAGISSKHALAIVNRGGATAREIIDLMHMIQIRVLELFGVTLDPEPVFVGFEFLKDPQDGILTPKI